VWWKIIDFIKIKLTPISLVSTLTNAPLACLCVAIHTSPLLTWWPHSFSYKIEEKLNDTIYIKLKQKFHMNMSIVVTISSLFLAMLLDPPV